MQLVLYLVHYSVYILLNVSRKLHHACLFADGPAVMVYEKRDPQSGVIRCAEVVEQVGPEAPANPNAKGGCSPCPSRC